MGKVVWRQAAIDDLDKIYDYIAQDAPARAASFADELTKKANDLSDFSQLGQNYLPNLPSVRIFPYKNYLFIFKPLSSTKGIELLRIFHGAQDYLNAFTDDL
ncbi:type II toxin-antitoxin system RelE/ParE family toxin [Pelagibius sp. Alg239-R121]|uniref:type II toxin-antitoxin system RelE/ParE family toxin n=1 Tax=Pelagibius sp. Alg239-R121 TaxID=2993448 RepID=UPI0024A644CB|nr:type II toxin-antitoxin system RelE/ParE family toxin [Pelagibius sp. Alg239-R121]